MPFGPLEDTVLTAEAPSSSSSRFRPYASPNHHVAKSRYITSNDPRGYIPVYEYPLNGQWIMMDVDDGYVLWTGIWKALGHSKADIVKMVESQPDLANQIRRVRGGYLKIQGTWMPYEVALRLARRVAWNIRNDLVPLFGPTFPSTCLSPDQAGYGQVIPNAGGRRRPRRSTNGQTSVFASNGTPNKGPAGWAIVNYCPSPTSPRWVAEDQTEQALQHLAPTSGQQTGANRSPTSRHSRYVPYPDAPSPTSKSSESLRDGSIVPPFAASPAPSSMKDVITLPPLQSPAGRHLSSSYGASALPPISSLDNSGPNDSRAVLARLRANDDEHARFLSQPSRQLSNNSRARRVSLDDQMHQRSQALLASTSHSFASYPRPRLDTGNAYDSSSTSGSPFERSPVSPVTPPHIHNLPALTVLKENLTERHEQGSRYLQPRAHGW